MTMKAGTAKYKGIKNFGFITGFFVGAYTNESISVGTSFDFFFSSYEITKTTDDTSTQGATIQIRDDEDLIYSYKVFPIMLEVGVKLPMDLRISPYVSGGCGLILAHSYFKTADTSLEDARGIYVGFGWKAMGGVDFAFTKNLKLTTCVAYHSSEPTRRSRFAMDLRGLEITGGLKIVLF
jgi:opacity protein-like surface antigen